MKQGELLLNPHLLNSFHNQIAAKQRRSRYIVIYSGNSLKQYSNFRSISHPTTHTEIPFVRIIKLFCIIHFMQHPSQSAASQLTTHCCHSAVLNLTRRQVECLLQKINSICYDDCIPSGDGRLYFCLPLMRSFSLAFSKSKLKIFVSDFRVILYCWERR